ncbi:MAG TPA: transposase [Candidatus Tectomicrobia bacterium]|jgi:transposase
MRQLATRFAVSRGFVYDLITRYLATGSVASKPHGGGYPATLDAMGNDPVRDFVHADPNATLQELYTRLYITTQVFVSRPTMSRLL